MDIPDYDYPAELEDNLLAIAAILKPLAASEIEYLRAVLRLSFARGVAYGIFLATTAINKAEEKITN